LPSSTLLAPEIAAFLAAFAVTACWSTQELMINQGSDSGADTDIDNDADGDTDADTGSETDTETNTETETGCSDEIWYGDVIIFHSSEIALYQGYVGFASDLVISCDDCGDIDGLICAQKVGGALEIRGHSLQNLDGLSSLTEVGSSSGGALRITFNDLLTDLDGLGALQRIGDTLEIVGNQLIEDLDGLAQIDDEGAAIELIVNGNPALQDVDGLSWADRLSSLELGHNSNMVDIGGLDGVTAVVTNLDISDNDLLGSIDFLGNLEELGAVSISNNDALTGLGVLPAGVIQAGILSIRDNVSLPSCEICEMVQNLAAPVFGDCADNMEDACWDEALVCP